MGNGASVSRRLPPQTNALPAPFMSSLCEHLTVSDEEILQSSRESQQQSSSGAGSGGGGADTFNNSNSSNGDDHLREKETCRFCLEVGDLDESSLEPGGFCAGDGRLVAPCQCRGTARFVHLGCLRRLVAGRGLCRRERLTMREREQMWTL